MDRKRRRSPETSENVRRTRRNQRAGESASSSLSGSSPQPEIQNGHMDNFARDFFNKYGGQHQVLETAEWGHIQLEYTEPRTKENVTQFYKLPGNLMVASGLSVDNALNEKDDVLIYKSKQCLLLLKLIHENVQNHDPVIVTGAPGIGKSTMTLIWALQELKIGMDLLWIHIQRDSGIQVMVADKDEASYCLIDYEDVIPVIKQFTRNKNNSRCCIIIDGILNVVEKQGFNSASLPSYCLRWHDKAKAARSFVSTSSMESTTVFGLTYSQIRAHSPSEADYEMALGCEDFLKSVWELLDNDFKPPIGINPKHYYLQRFFKKSRDGQELTSNDIDAKGNLVMNIDNAKRLLALKFPISGYSWRYTFHYTVKDVCRDIDVALSTLKPTEAMDYVESIISPFSPQVSNRLIAVCGHYDYRIISQYAAAQILLRSKDRITGMIKACKSLNMKSGEWFELEVARKIIRKTLIVTSKELEEEFQPDQEPYYGEDDGQNADTEDDVKFLGEGLNDLADEEEMVVEKSVNIETQLQGQFPMCTEFDDAFYSHPLHNEIMLFKRWEPTDKIDYFPVVEKFWLLPYDPHNPGWDFVHVDKAAGRIIFVQATTAKKSHSFKEEYFRSCVYKLMKQGMKVTEVRVFWLVEKKNFSSFVYKDPSIWNIKTRSGKIVPISITCHKVYMIDND